MVEKEYGCYFAGTRGSWECWACPNLKCPHMEIPYSDLEHSLAVAEQAAKLILTKRVTAHREVDPTLTLGELRDYLFREGFARVKHLKLLQASEAVAWEFATITEAALYAGVDRGRLYGNPSGN